MLRYLRSPSFLRFNQVQFHFFWCLVCLAKKNPISVLVTIFGKPYCTIFGMFGSLESPICWRKCLRKSLGFAFEEMKALVPETDVAGLFWDELTIQNWGFTLHKWLRMYFNCTLYKMYFIYMGITI